MGTLKKMWEEYGIGSIIVALIVIYGIYMLASYLGNKGLSGYEYNTHMQPQYKQHQQVQPSDPDGNNDSYASAKGLGEMYGMPASCAGGVQDPRELLPKDNNSQWAQLN